MRLTLTVPEQHELNDPTLELDPKRLKQQLASMPVLDAGESLYQLLNSLEPLNEQKVDPRLRFQLLSVYLPTALRLYQAGAPDDPGQKHLSTMQRQMVADYVERLGLAMANGFKLVLKEWFAENIHRSDPALFARVLRRACRQLGYALIHSYRCVRPVPPYLILELHQLYRLGRHFGIQDRVETTREGKSPISLAAFYKALMLLTLLDPYCLEVSRIERIFNTLLRYASKVSILAGSSWQDNPEALYFIDLVSDSIPRSCRQLTAPAAGEEPCLLDASALLSAMHKKLAGLDEVHRQGRPELRILKALHQS